MDLRVVTREKLYIPEWMGNKNLPAAEQISVSFKRFPGSSEMPNFMTESNSIDFKKFLFECVGGIKGLSVNGDPIKNGIALSEIFHEEILNLCAVDTDDSGEPNALAVCNPDGTNIGS